MAEQLQWNEVSHLVREVGHERWISTRLAEWREEADMTQADLAERMTELGYPMNKTSIWKIENPDKKAGRRAISIGESIGFARVFDRSLDELLLPPAALANLTGWQGYTKAIDLIHTATQAWARYETVVQETRERVAISPELRAQLEAEFEIEVEGRLTWMTQLSTSVPKQYGVESHDELARSPYFDRWEFKALRDLLGTGPVEHFTQLPPPAANDA